MELVPIIEVAVAVCDITRVLTPDEFASESEQLEIERLRERDIYLDPFDLRPLSQRDRYTTAEAEDLPEDFDPFSVKVEVVEPGEEIIPWSEADQVAAAAFETTIQHDTLDASLSASDRWLALRSPFRVTV